MTTSAATTPIKTLPLLAASIAVMVPVLLLCEWILRGPLFASAWFPFVVIPVAVAPMVATTFVPRLTGDRNIMAMVCVALACAGVILLSPGVHTSILAQDARLKVQNATFEMGRPPAIAASLQRMTQSYATTVAHQQQLEEIVLSQTGRSNVTQHIVFARQLGVDVEFVAKNGMVRPADTDALYTRALDLASDGDANAVAWLAQR